MRALSGCGLEQIADFEGLRTRRERAPRRDCAPGGNAHPGGIARPAGIAYPAGPGRRRRTGGVPPGTVPPRYRAGLSRHQMPCPVEPCLNRGTITTGHRSGGAMSGGTVPAGRKAGGCLAAPRRGAGDSPKGGNRRHAGAAALHQNSRTYGSTRGGGVWGFFPWVAALWGKPAHRGLGRFHGSMGERERVILRVLWEP